MNYLTEPTTGRVRQLYDHCFVPHVRGLLIAQQLLPHNFYVEMTPVSFNSQLIYLFNYFKSLTGVHDLAARCSTCVLKILLCHFYEEWTVVDLSIC